MGVSKFGDDDIDKIIAPTSHSKRTKLSTTKEGEEEKNSKNQEEKNLFKQEERMLDLLFLPTEWEDFAKSVGCFYAQAEFQKFKNYWLSDKAKKPLKSDWFKTWRNWIKREMGVFKDEKPVPPPDPYEGMSATQILEKRGVEL